MMSKYGFVSAHIYGNFLMLQIYKFILDEKRMVRFASQETSMRILTILALVCNIMGMCLMMKHHRTWYVVILHVLLPYGICTVLSYAQDKPVAIIGGIVFAVLLTAGYAFLIFRQKIKSKTRRKEIVLRRVRKVFDGLHCCLGTVLAVFAILCFVRVFRPQIYVPATVPATYKTSYTDAELLEMKTDFMRLTESNWNTLTLQEKLNSLQVVANLEQAYLGVPQTLTVVAADMEQRMCGYYRDSDWKIYMNKAHLETKSAETVLDTLCHEAYHAYQKRQVEVYCRVDERTRNLLMFRELESDFWESIFYADASKNYTAYYTQGIERDAREYAKKRVKVYEGLVEKLQEEGERYE